MYDQDRNHDENQFQDQYPHWQEMYPVKSVGCGVASMVLGIVGVLIPTLHISFFSILSLLPLALSVLAIILGGVGIAKDSGKGMAIAGLVLGILGVIPALDEIRMWRMFGGL